MGSESWLCRGKYRSRFLQVSIYSLQDLLDGLYGFFLEQRFSTLLAHPRRHIIDDEMISLARGRITDPFADQCSLAIKAFHVYPY